MTLTKILIGIAISSQMFFFTGSPNSIVKTPTATQTHNLYNRRKHKDYSKAAFSFGHRAGHYHLLYGSLTLSGDSDWFDVHGFLPENKSRIMDLGEKEWGEIDHTPLLPFKSYCPDTGGSCTPT